MISAVTLRECPFRGGSGIMDTFWSFAFAFGRAAYGNDGPSDNDKANKNINIATSIPYWQSFCLFVYREDCHVNRSRSEGSLHCSTLRDRLTAIGPNILRLRILGLLILLSFCPARRRCGMQTADRKTEQGYSYSTESELTLHHFSPDLQ